MTVRTMSTPAYPYTPQTQEKHSFTTGKYTLAFAGDEQACTDTQGFIQECERHFSELKSAESWEQTRFSNGSDAMAAALELVRRYKVSLPGNVCAVLMTTLVLEGWSSKLDPVHSVLEQVEDTLQRHDKAISRQLARWMQGEGAGGAVGLAPQQRQLVSV